MGCLPFHTAAIEVKDLTQELRGSHQKQKSNVLRENMRSGSFRYCAPGSTYAGRRLARQSRREYRAPRTSARFADHPCGKKMKLRQSPDGISAAMACTFDW